MVNANGREERGARVLVNADLNPPDSAMTVVLNTAQTAGGGRRIRSERRCPSGELRAEQPTSKFTAYPRPRRWC